MVQHSFATRVISILKNDQSVLGLAVAGSWLTGEVDEWSDLDLVMVTRHSLNAGKAQMLVYAERFGNLLSAFTGEHVGEPRLLICLYDDPLLHVDIKFVTLDEFRHRVESPVVLLDTDQQLHEVIQATRPHFPMPDYQWIEDRFWTWIHYALAKVGRGEYFEAVDFLGYLRMVVLGPLLHIKNNNLPRGVRKVETQLGDHDFKALQSTLAANQKASLLAALQNCVTLYRSLRQELFQASIHLNRAEDAVMAYFQKLQ